MSEWEGELDTERARAVQKNRRVILGTVTLALLFLVFMIIPVAAVLLWAITKLPF